MAIEMPPPPADAGGPVACSFHHPICVHGKLPTDGSRVLAVLAKAEDAWETLTGVLAFPAPDASSDGFWHLHLADGVDGGGVAMLEARDPIAHFDRASSYALVDRSTPPGCSLDLAVARAVARGSLWRSAPATDEGSARGEAETLARLSLHCVSAADDDTHAFQRQPERAIVDPVSPAFDRGATLFFGWLDATFGSSPGAFVRGLWALAPTRTPSGASRWSTTPTGFGVVRASLKGLLWTGSTLEDVFVRFAVERASMFPPPNFAWSVPWPERPRRLAAPEPVAPTGASYVRIGVAGAPAGARLHVTAEWEDYTRMRWVVLKLDASGKPLAQLPVGSTDRATQASMTVESLEGVDRIVLVGVNIGDADAPFDPDQGEWEPHGWLLTIGAE
jgi:hypothetical protein